MTCPYVEYISSKRFLIPPSKQCKGGYYPQDYINDSHYNCYCSYNNQNNSKECNFFPSESVSWHYCNNCSEVVYDTERFCPCCGSKQ